MSKPRAAIAFQQPVRMCLLGEDMWVETASPTVIFRRYSVTSSFVNEEGIRSPSLAADNRLEQKTSGSETDLRIFKNFRWACVCRQKLTASPAQRCISLRKQVFKFVGRRPDGRFTGVNHGNPSFSVTM